MPDKEKTYVAILRGINVSGKNMVKMPALTKAFEELGFGNVSTYVQSGNVVFTSEVSDAEKIRTLIYDKISNDLGLDVPVMVLPENYLSLVVKDNPFLKRDDVDVTKLHVTFLSEEPLKENIGKIKTDEYLPDEWVIGKKVIYLYCPNGYGQTKLHNNFFESKLKTTATTRNWKTVNSLLEIAGKTGEK